MRKVIEVKSKRYITICDKCEKQINGFVHKCRICEKVYCSECNTEQMKSRFVDSLEEKYASTYAICEECIKKYDFSKAVDVYNTDNKRYYESREELEVSINTLNTKINITKDFIKKQD